MSVYSLPAWYRTCGIKIVVYSIKTIPFNVFIILFPSHICSSSKAIEVLEAYEGTLEDDYPPENERYEHSEMLLYKVPVKILLYFWDMIAVAMLYLYTFTLS